MHAEDLALWPGSDVKFGLGLWSSLTISKGVELGLFLGGFFLYLGGTSPKGTIGRIAPAVVIAAMIGIEIYAATGTPPADIRTFAGLALVSYCLIAGLAAWLDSVRSPRQR